MSAVGHSLSTATVSAGAPATHPVAGRSGDGILRTRLVPPRPPSVVVDRPELVDAVLGGIRGRLVGVVAGAGYGKTTLLVQAEAASDVPWAWCSCDPLMGDAPALLAHLIAAVGERFPGFGARLRMTGTVADQVAALCNEVLDTVSDDFVLALDDVHLLAPSAGEAVGLLAQHLPANVHLVLAGRMPLPVPVARLRAERIVEIGEEGLAFDRADTVRLAAALGRAVDAAEVAAVHGRTEGWPAGLILALQGPGLRGSTEPGAEFDYLAEEVLDRQPPPVQDLLLTTSVCERLCPDLATAVSGQEAAADVLRSLVAGHLFTTRLTGDGQWYRYHHLFQAFLRARLAEADPPRLVAAHRRAAEWWLAAGEAGQAVPHLLAAGDVEGAADALEPVAERMALTSEAGALWTWLAALPPESWGRRPGLVLARAALLLAQGRHEASFAEIEAAIERLLEAGEHDRAATALFRLQQAMLTAGTRPGRRAEAGERYRGRISPRATMLPPARILLATAYGYGCRFAAAEAELEGALALPAAAHHALLPLYGEVARAFYVDAWQGRPQTALAVLQRAVKRLEAREEADELAFLPFAAMLVTYLLAELGRYEEALDQIASVRERFRRRGIEAAIERAQRWVRDTALVGLGRWEDLAAELSPPPRPDDERDLSSYTYRYRAPAARLAGHLGDASEVEAQIAEGRDEMRRFGRAFDDATFLCEFALAAADAGRADLAAELVAAALAAADSVGSPWLRARAHLVASAVGAGPGADTGLREALDLTARWQLGELWSGRERLLAPRLLTRAIARRLGPSGFAAEVLRQCGGRALGPALAAAGDDDEVRAELAALAGEIVDVDVEQIDRLLRDRNGDVRSAARRSWLRLKARPRAAVRLLTLGDLVVLREGRPVSTSFFARPKCRVLLAALLAAGGRAHRETLAEWLWPDLAPDRAGAALRTTLHELRRAVEPELAGGHPLSLLQTEAETVRLELGQQDSWDLRELRSIAATGPGGEPAAMIERLRAAEALYRGPFLAEWPFEEWALTARVELEELFKHVLEALADAFVAAGRPSEAVPRLRRLLRFEPERERWHRSLMEAHAAAGERALALRQYHACRTLLRRAQGIEPDPETRSLYERILRQ